MKRFTLLACALVSLAACSRSSPSSTVIPVTCDSRYWDGEVSVCVPQGWHALEPEAFRDHGLPQEVIAAFQANSAVSGQYPSMTVTRERLTTAVTPSAYSKATMETVRSLSGYKEIDVRDVTIEDLGVDLHLFSARSSPDQPKQKFYQVSTVKGQNGYSFTAAGPLSVDDAVEKRLLFIIEHVGFHSEDAVD